MRKTKEEENKKTEKYKKSVNYSALSGEDVIRTKLDLARTYIDMGETKEAKEILESVTKEGNEEQQNEAKSLLVTRFC